jgi:hypothetical protein
MLHGACGNYLVIFPGTCYLLIVVCKLQIIDQIVMANGQHHALKNTVCVSANYHALLVQVFDGVNVRQRRAAAIPDEAKHIVPRQ